MACLSDPEFGFLGSVAGGAVGGVMTLFGGWLAYRAGKGQAEATERAAALQVQAVRDQIALDGALATEAAVRNVQAVRLSLRHALEVLVGMSTKNDDEAEKIHLTVVPVSSVNAMLESARVAVSHALSRPFADETLLNSCLNLSSAITMMQRQVDSFGFQKPNARMTPEHLASVYGPFLTELKSTLETLQPSKL